MSDVEELKIVFRSEVDKAISDLRKASRAGKESDQTWTGIANNFSKSAKKSLDLKNAFSQLSLSVAGGIGIYNLASSAFQAMEKYLSDSIEEYRNSATAHARLAAQIQATGGAAGYTASQLADMADKLQDATQIDDDEITSAQSVLLKFTNISGDAFAKATSLSLDLSRAMGTDAAQAAQMLGRALEDPAEGLGAMRRAGVSLSDTEESLAKKFVAAGKSADAQAVILKAVEERVGGVAAATEKVDPDGTKKLALAISDLKKETGRGLAPAMKAFNDWLADMAKNAADARKGINDLRDAEAGSVDTETIKNAIAELEKEKQSITSQNITGLMMGFGMGASPQALEAQISSQDKELDARIAALQAKLKAAQEDAKKLAAQTANSAADSRDQAAAAYIAQVDAALKGKLASMELEAEVTNKEVSAQDKLNAYTDAYVRLISESNGLVSTNNPAAKAYAATIADLTGQVNKLTIAQESRNEADEAMRQEGESWKKYYDELNSYIGGNLKIEDMATVQKLKDQDSYADAQKKWIQDTQERYAAIDEARAKIDEPITTSNFEDWVDQNIQHMLKLNGVANDLVDTFGKLGGELASLTVEGTVDSFKELGAAFQDGKLSGDELGSVIADLATKILDELPMLFVQAGLSLIAQNPSMWAVGLGLVTAGLTSAFIDGFVDQSTSSQSSVQSAKGNVFDSGELVRFASGGAFTNRVVKRATSFSMGEMGERGAEAVMPLERLSDGRLGIGATGAGKSSTTVNIHNYSGQEVSTKTSDRGMQKTVEIMVGSLVDQNLASGRHDKALMGRYSVRRQVMRG